MADIVRDETAAHLGILLAALHTIGDRGVADASDNEILDWLSEQTTPAAVTGWAQEACLRAYRNAGEAS